MGLVGATLSINTKITLNGLQMPSKAVIVRCCKSNEASIQSTLWQLCSALSMQLGLALSSCARKSKDCMPPAGTTGLGITTCPGRQTSTPSAQSSTGTISTQSQPRPTPLTSATLLRQVAALGCCHGTCVRRRFHRGRLRQPGSPSQPRPGRPLAAEHGLSLLQADG